MMDECLALKRRYRLVSGQSAGRASRISWYSIGTAGGFLQRQRSPSVIHTCRVEQVTEAGNARRASIQCLVPIGHATGKRRKIKCVTTHIRISWKYAWSGRGANEVRSEAAGIQLRACDSHGNGRSARFPLCGGAHFYDSLTLNALNYRPR